jgi:hypothetical protein
MSDFLDPPVFKAPDGRHIHYVLDENGEAVPWEGSILGWGRRMDEIGDRRFVARNFLGDDLGEVITAFWGIDDAAATLRGDGTWKPCVFGTLVAKKHREFFDSTRAKALARHERIVDKLKRGVSIEDEDDEDQGKTRRH